MITRTPIYMASLLLILTLSASATTIMLREADYDSFDVELFEYRQDESKTTIPGEPEQWDIPTPAGIEAVPGEPVRRARFKAFHKLHDQQSWVSQPSEFTNALRSCTARGASFDVKPAEPSEAVTKAMCDQMKATTGISEFERKMGATEKQSCRVLEYSDCRFEVVLVTQKRPSDSMGKVWMVGCPIPGDEPLRRIYTEAEVVRCERTALLGYEPKWLCAGARIESEAATFQGSPKWRFNGLVPYERMVDPIESAEVLNKILRASGAVLP